MVTKDILRNRLKTILMEKFHISDEDDRGLQTEVAKALKCNPNVVGGWISKKSKSFPSPEYLIKINELLNISPNELLGVEKSKIKELPSRIDTDNLINIIEIGMETEDFLSFPIQAFGSPTQTNGQFPGQVVIHKRVFGRRKNLAAVQLNGGKEIKVVIVGK